MPRRPALSANAIELARQKLAAVPPLVPAAHSIRQAVDLLQSEILALRQKGYTLNQVAEHLNNAGIPVANSTLRNYTAGIEPRRKSGKNTPRPDVRKAPAPSKRKAASLPSPAKPSATVSTTARSGRFIPDPDTKDL